jgi:hypothetical protein
MNNKIKIKKKNKTKKTNPARNEDAQRLAMNTNFFLWIQGRKHS